MHPHASTAFKLSDHLRLDDRASLRKRIVKKLDPQRNDQLSLLVRPGRVNGEPTLIAEEIAFEGNTAKLPRPQDKERFKRKKSDRNDRSERGDRNRRY